jgi:hypothetical protein
MGLLVFVVIAGVVVLYYTYGQTSSKSRADKIYDEWINQSNVDPETRRRTIILAGHDMDRIERLLANARRHQPDRSEQWYWEKILYDMERDRRA